MEPNHPGDNSDRQNDIDDRRKDERAYFVISRGLAPGPAGFTQEEAERRAKRHKRFIGEL